MQRTNIIQITCHDLGQHIGPYGVEAVHTPALGRVAADGVRFARSFCTSPGCSPSRASLATGRYPHQNGVLGLAHAHFGWKLAPGERHIARLLAEAGYHTILFGLQHVTYEVESLGFSEIYPDRPADGVAENVARFLDSASSRQPFYAEINFFEPHRPFDFGGVVPDISRGVFVPPYLPDGEAAREEFALIQGAIRKADKAVATIDSSLHAAGLADNTLFLFTSDHGIAFPRAKGTLYDSGIEVALIIRWPSAISNTGRVQQELVSNVDVVPTLLEAAGAPVPDNIQGQSILPLLTGQPSNPRDCIFAEKTFHNEYDPMRCIRTGAHKLIVHLEVSNRVEPPADIIIGPTYKAAINGMMDGRGMVELYNLDADPLEAHNLAGEESCQGIRNELGQRLYRWMRDTQDPILEGPVASPFYYRAREMLEGF